MKVRRAKLYYLRREIDRKQRRFALVANLRGTTPAAKQKNSPVAAEEPHEAEGAVNIQGPKAEAKQAPKPETKDKKKRLKRKRRLRRKQALGWRNLVDAPA